MHLKLLLVPYFVWTKVSSAREEEIFQFAQSDSRKVCKKNP